MELVVDANVLVAAFLRSASTRELLLDERLLLSSPEWSLIEIDRVVATPQFRRRLGGLATAEVAIRVESCHLEDPDRPRRCVPTPPCRC